MKGRFRLLFTFRSCDERRLPFAPVALLSLRAERPQIPPRQWGYTWGYFCPRSYGNAVIPGPFAPVSTPTSHHQLFTYCRALDLCVPRSGVGRLANHPQCCAAGAGRLQAVTGEWLQRRILAVQPNGRRWPEMAGLRRPARAAQRSADDMPRYCAIQSSSRRPSIRENSRVLCVTKMMSRARA